MYMYRVRRLVENWTKFYYIFTCSMQTYPPPLLNKKNSQYRNKRINFFKMKKGIKQAEKLKGDLSKVRLNSLLKPCSLHMSKTFSGRDVKQQTLQTKLSCYNFTIALLKLGVD